MFKSIKPGKGGNRYVPYSERTGNESIVYFTRDLSPNGLAKVYEKVNANITGKVAIKLHTGEPNGPNIIPSSWIREFREKENLQDSVIFSITISLMSYYHSFLQLVCQRAGRN